MAYNFQIRNKKINLPMENKITKKVLALPNKTS
jgi:hypothetical protein